MQPATVNRGVIAADDSIIIRSNVRTALSDSWQVFLAIDGAEAIEYARRVAAELVLLDLRMPCVDGIDACAFIRTLPGYSAVPIVLLTAYDSPDVRQRAGKAGFTGVFAKPFSAAQLRKHALELIARDQPERPADEAAGPGRAEPSEPFNALSASRDILSVYRQVEAADKHRHSKRFAEIMAAWRAQTRR